MTRLGAAWSELFISNEINPTKETDKQLRERMQAQFPTKAKSTTVTRVSQMRGEYNAGKGIFKSYGPAGTPERPKSVSYGPGQAGRRKASKTPFRLILKGN